MKSMFFNKILWAVDVLAEPEVRTHALFVLGALTRPTEARVAPVFILNAPYADVSPAAESDFEQAYSALAEKRMQELTTKSDLSNVALGKVLVNRSGGARSDVKALIDHALETEADCIVVTTHGRTGLPRLFMGSFAETLALTSPVPVISVNPATKVRERLAKILLPTTFQPRFRETFERVAALAKTLDAEMTLFYKEPPVPGYSANPEIFRSVHREIHAVEARAKEWKDWATHYGVRAQIVIDEEPGDIPLAIERFAADQGFDLIAMATQVDPVSAILVGSFARRLIRHATCPVWVMKVDSN